MKKKTVSLKVWKTESVWRRCGAILVALSVLMSFVDFSIFSDITAQAAENEGRIVYFGNYIQREVTDEEELEVLRLSDKEGLFKDGKLYYQDVHYARKKDGTFYKDTPIAWRVLKDDGAYLTLLSDKVLESRAYGSYDGWTNSDIRKWLNEEFFQNAFTEEEQEQIAVTTLSSNRLVYMKPSVLETTEDKVYLPQEKDVMVVDISCQKISLAKNSFEYDGTAKCPQVIVEGLKEGIDYAVAYGGNIAVGTGTVRGTKCRSPFSGIKSVKIKK